MKSASWLEYSTLSITTVALPLSAGRIMILLSSCNDLMACRSVFEMFGFGGFDFSSACLTFYLCSWDEVEIIDRAEDWRIRRLKESADILSNNDLLSRPSIEMNTIWELIIK